LVEGLQQERDWLRVKFFEAKRLPPTIERRCELIRLHEQLGHAHTAFIEARGRLDTLQAQLRAR
jgi:hypothetical protein